MHFVIGSRGCYNRALNLSTSSDFPTLMQSRYVKEGFEIRNDKNFLLSPKKRNCDCLVIE